MARDTPLTVAVSGAGGFIGSALVASLERAGHRVLRLVRRAPRSPEELAWNPAGGTFDASRLREADAVVHLAAESLWGGPWTTNRKRKILESRVKGTSLLAETLAGLNGPEILISISATGIYGERGDAVLTEADPPGAGFLAEVVQAWEAASAPARHAGIRVIHPRLGVVLHPAGGMLRVLSIPFRLGLGARLGNGRQWLSWITLRDAIGAIRFLLDHPSASGPFNATAPQPVTNAEFTRRFAAALHRPAFLALPRPVLELILGELARELVFTSTRAVPARLTELGYAFQDSDLQAAFKALNT